MRKLGLFLFAKNNFGLISLNKDEYTCIQYANVIYRPTTCYILYECVNIKK